MTNMKVCIILLLIVITMSVILFINIKNEKSESTEIKYVLSNGEKITLIKEEPYYATIDGVTYKVFTTYYGENKKIIGYLNETTQVMIQEWYENDQLVNTITFDFKSNE